jgi:hypothetical protein
MLVARDAGLAVDAPELCALIISNRVSAEVAYLLEYAQDFPRDRYAAAVLELVVGELIAVTPQEQIGLLRASDEGVVEWFKEVVPRLRWTGKAFSAP